MTNPYLSRSIGDWTVDTNWAVYGADHQKFGTVDEVHSLFLVVGKGRLFRREYYIRVRAITTVERECVYLNVSTSEIDERDWDRIPDIAGKDAELYVPSVDAIAESLAAG